LLQSWPDRGHARELERIEDGSNGVGTEMTTIMMTGKAFNEEHREHAFVRYVRR
jgi:hypothetical protein